MKVAVCISGLPRSGVQGRDLRINHALLKRNFPTADFYFASWQGQEHVVEKYFPDERVVFFSEPAMLYHPFVDTPSNIIDTSKYHKTVRQAKENTTFYNTSYHQNKQIIAHALLVKQLPKTYDVIVRSRFDTVTFSEANFDTYIQNSYDNQQAIGFATLRQDWNEFDRPHEIATKSEYHYRFLFDQLIIHSANIFDPEYVVNLHQEKILLPAEFGWWQVLSKDDNHRNISGWANPDKSIESRYLK